MTVVDSIAIATIFGALTCIIRFAVLAWMPDSGMARLFRKTVR